MLQLDILFLAQNMKAVDQYFLLSTHMFQEAVRVILISSKRSLKISFLSIIFYCKVSWHPTNKPDTVPHICLNGFMCRINLLHSSTLFRPLTIGLSYVLHISILNSWTHLDTAMYFKASFLDTSHILS